jgi:hypothetical protein
MQGIVTTWQEGWNQRMAFYGWDSPLKSFDQNAPILQSQQTTNLEQTLMDSPNEILLEIFSYLGAVDLCNCAKACKRFFYLASREQNKA